MNSPTFFFLLLLFSTAQTRAAAVCRSYCSDLTIDYPFGLTSGCGHPALRDRLFCINGLLMLHLRSGSYRITHIDYSYHTLTLHDPYMSDCSLIRLHPHGFSVDPDLSLRLLPAPDTTFLLLGCSPDSPLFQGFPSRHTPCRNFSHMGCDSYAHCPAWDPVPIPDPPVGPQQCCAVTLRALGSVNLTQLGCSGYTSTYTLAPVRVPDPTQWMYGIRIVYSLEVGRGGFCRPCRATGGACGYDPENGKDLCLCGKWNSSTDCDHHGSSVMASGGGGITRRASKDVLVGMLLPGVILTL